MYALQGLTWLLILQTLGELLVRHLGLPLPGPVVGMGLLWLALFWTPVRQPVEATARFILGHLSLLFVPVGVGVMTHLSILGAHGWRVALALVLSTWIGLSVTALVLRALWRREETPGA
jgi:holin-like protein